MRKSQLYSQIFVYILSIILISFIMVYGYNAVQSFKKRAEQVSCLKFKNDLANAVDSISSDFGSVKKRSFNYVMATPRLALSRHLKAPICL